MGSVSKDPDGIPRLDPDEFQEATSYGLHPINVTCDEPGAEVGDGGGVSFAAFVRFLPRVGDRLRIEDGSMCQVVRVYHGLVKLPNTGAYSFAHNVYAIRIGPDK